MSLSARLAAAALLIFAQGAYAQADAQSAAAFPNRPIRYVVPFGAGGPSDILARTLAQRMTLDWSQPVVVENRTGAGGIIGADFVAKSVPDGYTLMMAQVGDAISMSLYSKLPYNFERDFAPVSLVGRIPFILVVHPSLPAKNLQDLIALARAKPGTLTFASGGTGVASHLAGELFKRAAGIDVVHVPYKGQAPATNDLLGGQVSFMFSNPLTALPHLKAGKMRALAVSSPKRFAELPDVPTIAEGGLAGFDVGFWLGAVAPAATPRAVVDKLNAETVRILRVPEVAERLGAMGLEIVGSTPDEFGRVIKSEVARWAVVIKEAGVKAE